ncbi:hypothetical protein TgHK011_000251 [Trichoderma gracile]|nr:hypothetical protein TgHK011_000251 [Trichoderma gracile]
MGETASIYTRMRTVARHTPASATGNTMQAPMAKAVVPPRLISPRPLLAGLGKESGGLSLGLWRQEWLRVRPLHLDFVEGTGTRDEGRYKEGSCDDIRETEPFDQALTRGITKSPHHSTAVGTAAPRRQGRVEWGLASVLPSRDKNAQRAGKHISEQHHWMPIRISGKGLFGSPSEMPPVPT